MNKEEYADKFMSRAKQDIKICKNKHELQIYIAGLLENIDYWQSEYDYMKKYRDTLQQENKQTTKKINKVIEYINTIQHITQPYDKNLVQQIVNYLLKILKGDSNEDS